jgi:fatty-acyl-CoA synthase
VEQQILREITIGALLGEAIAMNPDDGAVVYADRDGRWSYREFAALVDRVAKGLMALGVKRGEKVAVCATNVPHWLCSSSRQRASAPCCWR